MNKELLTKVIKDYFTDIEFAFNSTVYDSFTNLWEINDFFNMHKEYQDLKLPAMDIDCIQNSHDDAWYQVTYYSEKLNKTIVISSDFDIFPDSLEDLTEDIIRYIEEAIDLESRLLIK